MSDVGQWAENLALEYLEKQGLNPLDRNFRAKFGELDIIMEDGGCVVFVEVRYRASEHYGGPLASITRTKQRRLIKAASAFLKKNASLAQRPCRFDVVAVGGSREEPAIRWVAKAFS